MVRTKDKREKIEDEREIILEMMVGRRGDGAPTGREREWRK